MGETNMEFTALQAGGVAILSALVPSIVAYLKNGGLNEVISELQAQAEKITGDMRINPDGSITISATTAPLLLTTYENIEEISGKPIVNRKEVDWIKAVEPVENIATPEPQDATRPPRKVDAETFKWLMAGLPETEAVSVRAQVDAAEAKGLRQFAVTTSRWVYLIDNGLIFGDKDLRPGG